MIRTGLLVGIAMTSFGSIVGHTVRKEPLVNQIEDSGGIVIPFTIASGADSGGACTAVIVSSEDDEALGREPIPPELEHPPTTSAARTTIGSRTERIPRPAISTGSDLFRNPSSSSSTYRRFRLQERRALRTRGTWTLPRPGRRSVAWLRRTRFDYLDGKTPTSHTRTPTSGLAIPL